jgi:hypothetical protein
MKKKIYFLPEKFKDLSDLLSSNEFKEYIATGALLKTEFKAIDNVLKEGIPVKQMTALLSQEYGQSALIRFLKSLNPGRKGPQYIFSGLLENPVEFPGEIHIVTESTNEQIQLTEILNQNKTPNLNQTTMNATLTKQPLPKLSEQVHWTRDYLMFSELPGNRALNPLHLKRLQASMQDKYLFSPIIVNEHYQVIDGQHRLQCAKDLGLIVYFIICEGYGIREVQILNASSKNWNSDDYMQGYCDLGYKDYAVYKEFKEKYGFGHRETQALLEGGPVKNMQDFYLGKFKVSDKKKAVEMAEKLLQVGPFFEGYKMRSFVFAMLYMFKHKNFDFSEFLKKLKAQPTALKKCATSEQYKELIQEIYNYRSRNKVNLLF